MKKVLALALAGMMIASLSTVALAVGGDVTFTGGTVVGGQTEYGIGNLYRANSDGELTLVINQFKQGTTLYIPVDTTGMENKDVEKYKVKAEWSVGSDVFTGAKLEYKKVATGGYRWFVALSSKDATGSVKTADIAGTIKVYKGSSNSLPADQVAMISLGTYGFKAQPIDSGIADYPTYSTWTVSNDAQPYVYSFSNITRDSDETITFDGVGELQGNFYKQGKLYLGFNTKFNEEIAKAYPDANLDFTNFVGEPTLNKWGVMRLYAEKEQFVYTVENGKLVKVDATYDEDYEAFRFGVKKLGTYVLSDKELDVSKYVPSMPDMDGDTSSTPSEVPTEKPAVKPNPGTGR